MKYDANSLGWRIAPSLHAERHEIESPILSLLLRSCDELCTDDIRRSCGKCRFHPILIRNPFSHHHFATKLDSIWMFRDPFGCDLHQLPAWKGR